MAWIGVLCLVILAGPVAARADFFVIAVGKPVKHTVLVSLKGTAVTYGTTFYESTCP